MENSALMEYCKEMDYANPCLFPNEAFREIINKADQDKDFVQKFTGLWITEFDFRANTHLNLLTLIKAVQGMGKSLFAIDNCLRMGKSFGFEFQIERDVITNPADLEFELRKDGDRRRTFLQDEIPIRHVGVGSGALERSLTDWEAICRYSQKNIVKCTPETSAELNPYFWFKQVDYFVNRIENKTCLACPSYNKCQESNCSTLCDTGAVKHGIHFWQRDGYPKNFSFMLYTKRVMDGCDMPRGIVSLPIVTPKTVALYDKVKQVNMAKFEKFHSEAMKRLDVELEEFITKNWDNLTINKNDDLKVVGKGAISYFFYLHFGTQRFTKGQVESFLIDGIKAKVLKKINEKINIVE